MLVTHSGTFWNTENVATISNSHRHIANSLWIFTLFFCLSFCFIIQLFCNFLNEKRICVVVKNSFHALNINRMSTAFQHAYRAPLTLMMNFLWFQCSFWHTKDFIGHRFLTGGRHQNFLPKLTKNSRLTGSKRSDGLKQRFFSMTQLLELFERRRWKTGVWFEFRFASLVALCAGVPKERCIVNIVFDFISFGVFAARKKNIRRKRSKWCFLIVQFPKMNSNALVFLSVNICSN